ncbi:MAG: class I SAM-dependent methyltransferase, partial [Bacteroidetes bacterium]
ILPARVRLKLRQLFLLIRGWWFRGNTFFCPCCERHYRAFLDMKSGDSNRPNVVCPGCGVVERHRLLRLYLETRTDLLERPGRVLYFAPELSMQTYFRHLPNIEYISADIDSAIATEQFDIMDIPHADQSFSLIICSHVLAHVRDDQKALKELFRILKNDGLLILLDTPAPHATTIELPEVQTPEERRAAYGQADRWRRYGQDFVQRITSVGFEVAVEKFAETLPEPLRQKCRISNADDIYLCQKKNH